MGLMNYYPLCKMRYHFFLQKSMLVQVFCIFLSPEDELQLWLTVYFNIVSLLSQWDVRNNVAQDCKKNC
jgi:hypothetical protein